MKKTDIKRFETETWATGRMAGALVACCGLGLNPLCVHAQPIIAQSTFDTDAEGWTTVGVANPCTSLADARSVPSFWINSSGPGGGFFRTEEVSSPANYGSSMFLASSAFLGDISRAYGGVLVFDHRYARNGGITPSTAPSQFVFVQGAGLTLSANLGPMCSDGSVCLNQWVRLEVTLGIGPWKLGGCSGPPASEAQIREVLANVTSVQILGEHINGGERDDLDNVILACRCAADFDNSGGTPDTNDIDSFFLAWLAGTAIADADCSGGAPDITDIDAFFTAWLAGGC